MLEHVQPRTVVIAPDSFKGTASATAVAGALAAGWRSIRPADTIRLKPMADGGEGTLEAFEMAVPGTIRMSVAVTGPDGRVLDAFWLLLPDGSGVIELANTSGITLLDPLLPLDAHSTGFGQAIAAALDHGVNRLILAIGGSASTDGGLGVLTALGARFLDADGRQVQPGNRGLGDLVEVDLDALRPLPTDGARILSDVTNPLLGRDGASAVFGPQKGADAVQVAQLESHLVRLAGMIPVDPAIPGAGAAGGVGFGLLAWGAWLDPGSAAVGEVLGVEQALHAASPRLETSVLITGEGRFDEQSAAGKVPSYLQALANEAGACGMLVAGSIEAETSGFTAAVSLTQLAGSAQAAIHDTLHWLEVAGARLAASLDISR